MDFARLSARAVRALAAEISLAPADLQPRVERAIAYADYELGLMLLMASALAGRRPDLRLVATLLAAVPNLELTAALIGLAGGDRAEALIELLERWQLGEESASIDQQTVVLYAAWRLGASGPLPARLLTPLRRLARQLPPDWLCALVAAVARAVEERHVVELALYASERAETEAAQKLLDQVSRALVMSAEAALRLLPAEAEKPALESGEPSLLPARHLRDVQVAKLSLRELLRLRREELSWEPFVVLFERLVLAGRLRQAAASLDARASDAQSPAQLEALRVRLVHAALASRQLDFARDQARQLPSLAPFLAGDRFALDPLLVDFARRLDRLAREVFEDPAGLVVYSFADALLAYAPYLGILVARGCLVQVTPDQRWELLDRLEDARDQLQLRFLDNIWDLAVGDLGLKLDPDLLPEPLLDEESAPAETPPPAGAPPAEPLLEGARLGRALDAGAQRIEQLEAELAEREQRQRQVEAARPLADAPLPAAEPPLDEVEQRRLRRQIAELHAQLLDARRRQQQLRQKHRLQTAEERQPPAGEPPPEVEEGAAFPVDERPRRVLIPRVSRRAGEAMLALTERLAAEALRIVSALAGNDEAAWRALRRSARGLRQLLVAEVGARHRLLLERDQESGLLVLDLVPREELGVTLDGLVR